MGRMSHADFCSLTPWRTSSPRSCDPLLVALTQRRDVTCLRDRNRFLRARRVKVRFSCPTSGGRVVTSQRCETFSPLSSCRDRLALDQVFSRKAGPLGDRITTQDFLPIRDEQCTEVRRVSNHHPTRSSLQFIVRAHMNCFHHAGTHVSTARASGACDGVTLSSGRRIDRLPPAPARSLGSKWKNPR